MKLSDRLNCAFHPVFALRLRNKYRREVRGWEKKHPESFGQVSEEVRKKHFALWGKIMPTPQDGWLRLLTKLSGHEDFRFMPSDAYYSVVERCLNDCNAAYTGIDDKNNMSHYIQLEYLPRVVIRYVRGVFFDEEFRAIPASQADELLSRYKGDVVGKCAADTCGGASVHLFRVQPNGFKTYKGIRLTTDWIERNYSTYIVQECLEQENVIKAFNPGSINTCRIVTFRRPWSGDLTTVACMLRMGAGSEIVDNVSSGGACIDVDMEGRLADTGSDPNFGIIDAHPSSGKSFHGVCVPHFSDMSSLAVKIANRVPDYNILGFDMIVRPDGRPCVIEVNTTSLAIVMVQMRRPLFGNETERVVDWCQTHRALDFFRHFRTFY